MSYLSTCALQVGAIQIDITVTFGNLAFVITFGYFILLHCTLNAILLFACTKIFQVFLSPPDSLVQSVGQMLDQKWLVLGSLAVANTYTFYQQDHKYVCCFDFLHVIS